MAYKKGPSGLTPKQEKFVAAYLAAPNATEALRQAGYRYSSEGSAQSKASILLKDQAVAAAIAVGKAKTLKKMEATADGMMNELCMLAFSNIADVVDLKTMQLKDEIPVEAQRAIASIKVKYERSIAGQPRVVESMSVSMHNKNSAVHDGLIRFGLLEKKLPLDKLLSLLGPLGQQLREYLTAMENGEEVEGEVAPKTTDKAAESLPPLRIAIQEDDEAPPSQSYPDINPLLNGEARNEDDDRA